ncbi:helix-turn-helix transcriptional regulator [Olivibacter sp. SDN3]|uniref:helix-turn-helix domain-containing protein n=1 Tax=Olivibacter sp. SDN3 TaxID=2764720 RepID=UPI00165124FF|nr:helix-turn-helix transcriptional regulator [Olivibacter sp. SDN3]QNL49781.1 helix-turn-helix transcriptional regulator [Olivibacter sp. SDN3]
MVSSIIIEEENKKRKWTVEEAAELAKIDISEFKALALGERDPSYEEANKLSALYNLPIALFVSSSKQPIYVNTGTGTYNNSVNCYIGTYSGDSSLKDLVKDLISTIKPDIVWPKEEK